METLSTRMARAVALGIKAVHVTANPARRGPIVLATDGTSTSGAAVAAAQALGERLDLPIAIVSVLERLPTFTSGPDVIVPIDPAVDDQRARDCETHVSDYVARYAGGTAPALVHVRFGDVATEIARFARERSATLVVMGSSPHRRFQHMVSGKAVSEVLGLASCPVLSVPPTFASLPRTVVTAVDFGPTSVATAQAAMLLVADGGTVVLTHVVPPPVRPAWLQIVSEQELAVNLHALFDVLLEEMGPCVPAGVTVQTRTVTGETVDSIVSSAPHDGSGAIVIGTHGAAKIVRAVLGSVADSVLRQAECAVLLSPAATGDKALGSDVE
jgi:nucleotide-binding universal stress UspA family protein